MTISLVALKSLEKSLTATQSSFAAPSDSTWTYNTSVAPTNTTTPWSISPSVGNLIVIGWITSATAISSISGGGVSTWSHIVTNSTLDQQEMWSGVVTSSGSTSLTITTGSAVPSGGIVEIVYAEWSSSFGASTSWTTDKSGSSSSASSVSTITYPTLTPTSGFTDVYFGYALTGTTPSAGTTSGYTYYTTAGADEATYNTGITAASGPTNPQSPASVYSTVAGLFHDAAGSGALPGPLIVTSQSVGNASFF